MSGMKRKLNPFCGQGMENFVKSKECSLNPFYHDSYWRGLNQSFNYLGENDSGGFDNKNEQLLVQSAVKAGISTAGYKAIYITRTVENVDRLLGEQPDAKFENSFEIEVIMEDPASGLEDEEQMTALGFWQLSRMYLYASYERMREEFGKINSETGFAQPGDIIFVPATGKIFQILHLTFESKYFALGTYSVIKFDVQNFDKSSETFNTGHQQIDEINDYEKLFNDPIIGNPEFLKEMEAVSDDLPRDDRFWEISRKRRGG
jgi:hypothetical protein